jgi:hypothetical protein
VSDELVKRLERLAELARLCGDDVPNDDGSIEKDAREAAAILAAQSSTIARLEHALLTERGKLENADYVAQELMARIAELETVLRAFDDPALEVTREQYRLLRSVFPRAAIAPAEPKEGTP